MLLDPLATVAQLYPREAKAFSLHPKGWGVFVNSFS